jgi:type VI secretion system secreted protein VgrG
MKSGYTQDNVYLSVSTPLGKDTLLLWGFHGEERLSTPFHFTLELRSQQPSLSLAALVGQGATVTLGLPEGGFRYFHGIVTRFTQSVSRVDFSTWIAELRPALWLLMLTRDSRIFQNQSVPEIVKLVLREYGVTDVRDALKGSYAKREYCVQYQESAFHFVSRLLEEEGIFYFFEHAKGKHTLVLADDPDAHAACPGLKAAKFGGELPSLRNDDRITECSLEQQVTPTAYAVDDFNFEIPSTDLAVQVTGDTPVRRIYEYPGGFALRNQGEARAKARLAACEQPAKTLHGRGRVRAFSTGYRFNLKDHPLAELNGTYVLRWISHAATVEQYENRFEALPVATPFRPPRVTERPRIVGAQTAIVVGKRGEEIWTDKYGRVKVQFHWDQRGKYDENSSCWIRVAQGWAGKGWGSLFLPRIGQEVLVSFLEGDPDRPLVTGSVYNAEQPVPYPLPAEQTKSTVKSNSSKGGGGFNELRFEDKKGQEEVFFHAQKDLNTVVIHDETHTVKEGNRTVRVETGNETHEVKGTRDVTVTGNETHVNEADFTQRVKGNFTLEVTGNLTIDVKGNVLVKSAQATTHKTGTDFLIDAGVSLTSKAGVSLKNEAGVSLESKAGATQTVDGGGLLTCKGGLVKIN